MPTAKAILHSSANKAGSGDAAAGMALVDIMDMTGRTNEITDEATGCHASESLGVLTRLKHGHCRVCHRSNGRIALIYGLGACGLSGQPPGDDMAISILLKSLL